MPTLGVLDWQVMSIGLGSGLFTKTDKRFSSPPSLDIARDVQFEELGGVQTRLPFSAMANAIFGGGTLANCRRLATVNGELCVFTDTGLYSWNAQLSQWMNRGAHLAVSVAEDPRFSTTGDQIDADRAELNGTIVVAWTEGTQVYAGALDKSTGAVLVSPTAVSTAVGRPRLVAMTTRILLFVDAGGNNFTVRAIDPAAPGTALSGAGSALSSAFNGYYDVARVPSQDTVIVGHRRVTTTAYSAVKVTWNGTSITTTTQTPGRVCDGPIAVSVDPTGTNVQIVRANGTNIEGDLLAVSGLTDVFTAQPIGSVLGTPVNQIAAAHRSVQNGGAYRCYVFWDSQESSSTCTWLSQSNWVDTANTRGTPGNFVRHLAIASRAFDYNGSVYVWLAFGGATVINATGAFTVPPVALQNSYFLHRDDAFLLAKTIAGSGGGFVASTGRLPGVALTSGTGVFSWCGLQRRRVAMINDGRNFAAREPVDVTFTFDANDARRCVQLGGTLYIAAGEILAYDGVRIVELGHHVYPWVLSVIDASGGGSVAVGTYAYKATWRYQNAQGEVDRSTTATIAQITVTGNSTSFPSPNAPLTVTHKTAVPPAVEIWRTQVNPTADAPFYLATSNDPTALTNPNRYVPNDPTLASLPTFTDFYSDSTLATKEINPENGGVLEALAPPAAKIVIATDTRLFLAGVAGDPDRIWYSRERNDGEVASFHDSLTIDVPPAGGAITSLWVMDGVLYVGRQYAIYALPGTGFDNTGGGANFGPAQIVSLDVGPVSQEAQCLTPPGLVFFSSKGWYLCDRARTLRYIGGAVNAFDADTVLSVDLLTSRHEVRALTNNRMLVWTYTDAVDLVDAQTPGGMGQWSERTIADGLDAVLWNGSYVYLTSTGPKQEQTSYSGLSYGIDVETSWIKLRDLQGYGKVSEIMILGEYRSAHLVRVRVARDYQYDVSGNVVYFDDKAWSPSPTTIGSALQVRHTPSASNGNCEAIKIRITAVAEQTRATLATSSALAPSVSTSGTVWAATWAAVSSFPGLMGNSITMTCAFAAGATPSVDVRDHFAYSVSLGRWIEDVDNVGILVTGTNASTTVAALEAAIAAASKLCTLQSADATPGKLVAIATQSGTATSGSFSGGAYTSPSGEAIKLTGIALRVGLKPGLYNRLPAAQKQ
jgi:hypothetical protein